MAENIKAKELHLATSLEGLNKLYALPSLVQKKTQALCKTAAKLFEAAETERLGGDEERAYVLYMKYLQVISDMQRSPNYVNDKSFIKASLGAKNPRMALDFATALQDSLRGRYQTEARRRRERDIEKQMEVQRKIDEDRRRAREGKLSGKTDDDMPGDSEVSIECKKLYALLKDYDKKILIMDTRRRKDFEESHMNFLQCISVPESLIVAGNTANRIEQNLPPESKLLWTLRMDMDLIVLLDWSSAEIVPGKTLHTLRTILLKWDRDVIYKREPVILDGGYEEWLNCYPTCTTNSHVSPPNRNVDFDDFLNDVDYSELTLSLSPNETQNIYDTNLKLSLDNNVNNNFGFPSVDRSSKAAALSTYEENSKRFKRALEEQEKLANDSLNIEKQRLLAEKSWESLNHTQEDITEETTQSNFQLKESELLSELLQLENAQRDKAMENQRLKEELAEYKRREREAKLLKERSIVEAKIEKPIDLDSPNANYSLDEINDIDEAFQQQNAMEAQRRTEEARIKEEKIKAIEEQKAAVIRQREALQIEREKKLAEAREKKKLFGQNENNENAIMKDYNNSSSTNSQINKENDPPAKIPQIDRATKPSKTSIPDLIERYRDFQPVMGCPGYGLTGLKNLGNTCYMNSIIQCLNNTSYLVQYFCNGQYREHVCQTQNNKSGTCGAVAEEVAAVIKALWSGQYRFISTKDLKNVVGQYKNMFRGVEQQDSHEFLTILMDWLHNDLQIPINREIKMDSLQPSEKAWHEYTKSKESLILKLFYGQIKSTVRCLECGKESVTYDSFSNISLELPTNANKCTLSDCLELYLKDERIHGWLCPLCKQKRDAVKKLDISRLPPVLVIHFKRFYIDPKDYVSNTYRKKQTYIDFPLTNLDMGKFSLQNGDRSDAAYNLYGVSNHYGSMEGGHYTAYCKSSHYSKWFKFDDHVVTEISPNEVRSSAAYILFYTSLPESALRR